MEPQGPPSAPCAMDCAPPLPAIAPAAAAAAAAEPSAGAVDAHECTDADPSSDRHAYCTLCPARIQRKQPSRPHGTGRAHQACIKAQERRAAAASGPVPRIKRPYDTLRPTQRRERRKQLRAAVAQAQDQVGCPIAALQLHPRATPAELIHLSTSVRERIRSVPSLRIPSEQTMIQCKQELASTPERIVPTPLHLFLGISNRIILDAFSELLGKERVQAALSTISTVHSAGCGGKSDLYDRNGPEISKFIKQLDPEKGRSPLKAAAASPTASAAQKASHSVLSGWLKKLQHHLLHKGDWELKEIEDWRAAVDDILKHFCKEAHCEPFPKLHMLHHTVHFAERHRFLGRASEAQIESFHAQFNALFHQQHRNQGGTTDERLRRSLADAALRAVQPFVSLPQP